MKNILLIGLGRFGRHMAQALTDLHHQVLVIDKDEHKVQEALSYVTNAEIGDATDPELIDSLGVSDFDLCVVTMSHDLQASLEITALLKKKGAPFVLVRVSRDTHAEFLLSCGADEIIYPESRWRNGRPCVTAGIMSMIIPGFLRIMPFMRRRFRTAGSATPLLIWAYVSGIA